MQKEHTRLQLKPHRLFEALYQDHRQVVDGDIDQLTRKAGADAQILPNLHKNGSVSTKTGSEKATSKPSGAQQGEDEHFAQRYIDEIAPPSKMKEYQAIADQQRSALMKETKNLQARFSEDMLLSLKLEQTVMGISQMVTEFATLLESQSPMVEDIGEVAKDVKASMKSADEELLVTLERTQSQNWNMIILVLTLSVLLLILHVVTP
jgi:hypothetical protein